MGEQGGADVIMVIKADGCPDSRRYNAPTAQEIAVILPNEGYGEDIASRDIVLYCAEGRSTAHYRYSPYVRYTTPCPTIPSR